MKKNITAVAGTKAAPQTPSSPLEGEPNPLADLVGGLTLRISPHRNPSRGISTPPQGGSYKARFIASALLAILVLFITVPAHATWQTPGIPTQELATAQPLPAPGITATLSDPYFKITGVDVEKAVAEQLQLQAVEQKADVSLNTGDNTVIHSADHALKLVIHGLQIDTQSKRWQAQAYIVANGKTETVKPVSGTYMGLIDVPVLTRQLGKNDVIEASDLATKSVPQRLMRKETVTNTKDLIGQSPRAVISPDRPIRMSEISSPILIKKGEPVQMSYTSPYMSIRTSGVALQDGAKGEMIRVKNDKSEKAVSGRVEAAGRVEVNNASAM